MIEEECLSLESCGHCGRTRKCVFVQSGRPEAVPDAGEWFCAECARAITGAWACASKSYPGWFESERSKL